MNPKTSQLLKTLKEAPATKPEALKAAIIELFEHVITTYELTPSPPETDGE